jgi:hypothetical protein
LKKCTSKPISKPIKNALGKKLGELLKTRKLAILIETIDTLAFVGHYFGG